MGSGLISGKQGESLFHEPLIRFFRANPTPELLNKTAGLKDDRLLAIVSALIIEDRLDHALSSFLPKYKRLTAASGFTFSMKINLMEALAMIPPRILTVADLFRKIRNEFAHNLDLAQFSDLAPKFMESVDHLHTEIHRNLGAKENQAKPTAMAQYKFLTFFCIVGLDSYSENLSYLRAHIGTTEFLTALFMKSQAENMEEFNTIRASPAVKVELRDGHRIEYHEKGLVVIGFETKPGES